MRLELAIALLVLTAGTARAGNVTVGFDGILMLADGIPGAGTGTLFSGTYTYDDTASLQLLGPGSGRYDFGSAFPATGFSLVIHTSTPVTFGGTPLRDIGVGDLAAGDSLAVVATTGAGGDFRLDLAGGPGLFSSLALVPPDLSQASGTIQYTNFTTGMVLLMGALTSLAVVPEPSGALLLGLALAGLAWRRARV